MASRSRSGSRSRGARDRDRDERRWSGEPVELRTPFALAQVIPEPGRPWRRLLRLDGEDCSHVDLRDPTAIDFAYVRRFADLSDLLAPPRAPLDVVHLGGGGFTLPRYLLATRPGARNEVAEIDPGLVELARAELGLRSERGLRVRVLDARELLERRDPASADLVVLDAFHGTDVPSHLTTAEFLAAARRVLRPRGAFAANVIDVPPLEVARAVAAGALESFEQVAVMATRKTIRGRQGGNVVVLAASGGVLPLAELGRRALRGGVPELAVTGEELTRWLGGARPYRDPAPAAPAPPAQAPDAEASRDASPPASGRVRRITWLGHATVLIETDGGARLLTDPLLRGRVAHLRRHAPQPAADSLVALDAVLLSHVHHDHLDRPSLRTLAAPSTQVVLPLGGRRLVGGLGFGAVREVASGTRLRAGAAEVEVVPAWHPARRWPRSPQLDALGYLVEGIWFAGDTDLHERMAELRGRVEVALVPIWGWGPSLGPGHLDPAGAARAVALVRPRIAIPIHWGTYLPYGLARRHGQLLRSPAGEFATAVARAAPATRVETLAPGATLELP